MPEENDSTNVEQHAKSENGRSKGMLKKLFNAGVWTALFTGVLMIFSGLLYQVSKSANNTKQESERAFLSIAFSPRLQPIVVNGRVTEYKVHMGWMNNGTTPTKNAVAQFNVADSSDSPGAGLDFDSLPEAGRQAYVLGPKAAWDVTPVKLTFSELADARANKHLFAWGCVVYRDVFRGTRPHVSEFCFELKNPKWLGANHHSPNTPFTMDTPPCPTHNCYDENCKDYSRITQ